MAGLHFDITGDNANFLRKLDEARNGVRSTSKQIEESGVSIEQMFGRLAKGAAAFGAGITAKEIVSNIVRVRGEFQQLEVAFKTMLGSEEQANTLMGQLVNTAAKTPFDLQGVANGAKQLLAYGTSAEDVNGTLVRLGDIAAGLSIPLGDLVYLYGTTMTQGRLFTQDLRQFQGRGIPLADELAKQFGVAKDKVGELVTAGKVGFPEVQKAIEAMTNDGGKFGGLMEAQSKTITGQVSNIEDSIATMYNNIGKQSEGFINDALSGVSYLVENYEAIGKTVLELAAVYGTYKAAIIVLSAVEKARYTATLAMGATEKTLTTWQAIRFASTEKLTSAQKALNAAMLKNPYVLAGAAIAGLGYGIYKLTTYQTDAEKAQLKLNDAIKEAEKASLSEHRELARLKGELSALTKGSDEYNVVKDKIIKNFGKYYSGLDTEIEKVGLTEQAYTKLTDAINKSFGARQYEKFASEQQEELSNTMSENLSNIQERLLSKLGDDYGSKVYAKIRNGIMQGSLSLGTKAFEIQGLDDEAKSALDKVAGKDGGLFDVTNRSIEGYIQNIILANRATEQLDEKARSRFGIDDNSGKKTDDTKVHSEAEKKAASEWLSSYKKAYEDADKAYNDFLKSKQVMSEADRDRELKRLKEERDMAKSTYEGKGGSVSSNTKQDNQADKLLQQQEKYNLFLDKQKLEQIRAEEDRWNQVWQAQIDADNEGSKKALSQMELNHERELQAIDREKDDLLKKKYDEAKALFDADEAIKAQKTSGYKPQSFDGSAIVLSPTESTQFDSKYKSTLDKQAKERQAYYASEKQAMNEYLAEYGEYMQKRQAIVDLYNERIAKATTKGEKLSLGEEMKKSLASVDDEVQKKTSIITKLFSDMNKRTVADMRAIADEAQAMLDYVNGGEFKTDDSGKGLFGLTKEQFDILSKSPEKLESIKNEIANVKTEADNAETSFDKMANGLDKVFSAGRDTKKLKEGLAEIESGMNDVMQVAGFLSNTLSSLGDAFGNDTFTGIADGINVAMGALSAGMEGAKAGAMFGPIGAAAGAAIGVVSSLASSISKIHDAKNEKRIQSLQDQIEVLEKSYDKLGASIEKSYSKDASKLIEQNNQMLEQQKVLIQNQIREEQDKKKTDDGRIKEWQNQIEEINKLIDDNKEKAIDAIFGEDLKSSIDNFAQAYANAWTSGEDKAKSAKDTVRDMMRQMVTESIKAAIQSSGKMEEIRNKLKQFYADNVLSGWEQDYIYNMADNLQKELDGKFAWADDLMKNDEDTSREASQKGIATTSQESVDENNGRLTAIQGHTYNLNENVGHIANGINSIAGHTANLSCLTNIDSTMKSLITMRAEANTHLANIDNHTANLINMREDMHSMKQDINTMLIKGLKLSKN